MAKKQVKPDVPQGKGASSPDASLRHESKDTRQKNVKTESRPNPVTRFIRYVEACRAELRKVTWPTLQETRKATIAVLVFIGIMAIILGLIDLGLSSLIKTILS